MRDSYSAETKSPDHSLNRDKFGQERFYIAEAKPATRSFVARLRGRYAPLPRPLRVRNRSSDPGRWIRMPM
jgi:hypothetical protein